MPKILLLVCGGTVSMSKNEFTSALESTHAPDHFLQLEPKIKDLAEIEVKIIENIDSSNMKGSHWETLVNGIADNYEQYDGFVITMGTDTMAFCSSALSFALSNIGKPVILTGAQIPAENSNTDAGNNLLKAMRVATMNIRGVYVVFGSKIILGCRAKKNSESDLNAFITYNQPDFGTINSEIIFNSPVPAKNNAPLQVANGFDGTIVSFTLIPGLPSSFIQNPIDNGAHGIILCGFGAGNIPYDLLPALNYAHKKLVPVVVTTQCPSGTTIMNLYDVGLKAIEAGAIQSYDMSIEAISTKLMWVLKRGLPYSEIKKIMETNLVGELNPNKQGATS